MKYVVGIDIGTGSAKAVALSLDNEILAVSQHYYPTYIPQPGYSEQNPELIWEAFKNCLQEILQKLPSSPEVISFSSAMHSLIAVNATGGSLTNMITWADCRSDDIAMRLGESAHARHIYEISGMPIHAMSPLCKIIWLNENRPELAEQVYKYISIKEYVWFKLFGEYVVDYSIAGASGMLDIKSLSWSPFLLQLACIREDQLSALVPTTYVSTTGTTVILSGRATQFVIGASDGCLANLGSYAIRQGVAAITIGTSGAVRIAHKYPIVNHVEKTFSYYLDEGIFICGGPVNNGGNVLQWLVKEFLDQTLNSESVDDVLRLIETVAPGARGLFFLPYLHGERAPVWDAKSSGAFVGVRAIHSRAHFCRAVLEGICYALNNILLAVQANSVKIEQINVSGGFIHSQSWMQMLADITGKKIILVQTEDASAIGAALLGMKAVGATDNWYNWEPRTAGRLIEPDMEKHGMYTQHFSVFQNLYPALKESMHQIHLLNS